MSGLDIEQELDRLYARPLAEFIGARNELAKTLRISGDRLTKSSRLAGQLRAFLWMSIQFLLLGLIGFRTPTRLSEEARMDNPYL